MLPRAKMVNADLARIINSDEVQSVVKPIKKDAKRAVMKKNPLKNLNVMLKLNPYAKTAKRMSLLAEAQRVKSKKEKLEKKRKPVTKVNSTLSFLYTFFHVYELSVISNGLYHFVLSNLYYVGTNLVELICVVNKLCCLYVILLFEIVV